MDISIKTKKGFDDVERSKIALIDIGIEQRPLLLKVTFNREKSAYATYYAGLIHLTSFYDYDHHLFELHMGSLPL
ncbi:MAG: hypothetical protein GY820_33470 [Gammaproteobacteria bacterium]|nr:hypothetical protein [Gammaproteobacteria bacterium]